jgi:hypothetical protein
MAFYEKTRVADCRTRTMAISPSSGTQIRQNSDESEDPAIGDLMKGLGRSPWLGTSAGSFGVLLTFKRWQCFALYINSITHLPESPYGSFLRALRLPLCSDSKAINGEVLTPKICRKPRETFNLGHLFDQSLELLLLR